MKNMLLYVWCYVCVTAQWLYVKNWKYILGWHWFVKSTFPIYSLFAARFIASYALNKTFSLRGRWLQWFLMLKYGRNTFFRISDYSQYVLKYQHDSIRIVIHPQETEAFRVHNTNYFCSCLLYIFNYIMLLIR